MLSAMSMKGLIQRHPHPQPPPPICFPLENCQEIVCNKICINICSDTPNVQGRRGYLHVDLFTTLLIVGPFHTVRPEICDRCKFTPISPSALIGENF